MKRFLWILALIVCLGLVALYNAFKIEPNRVTVETFTLHSDKIAAPLLIIQLSDLHTYAFDEHEQKVVARVNQLQPDIILFTGDLFPGSNILEATQRGVFDENVAPVLEFLTALEAKYGVWVSRGNDDFSDDKEINDLLPEALEANGIPVLTNTAAVIPLGADSLFVAGVDFTGLNIRDIADFFVTDLNGERVLQSTRSRENSTAHYADIKERRRWQNYMMTGRMLKSRVTKDGIGITFYSQTDRGYDKYYRLRQANQGGKFHFSPHSTTVFGDSLRTDFSPEAERWVRFKIECRTLPASTYMRAKVWYQDGPEPAGWMAAARDTSATRLTSGSAGLWSGGLGNHYYDDITVVTLDGDTLLNETFDDKLGPDPMGWTAFGYPNGAIKLLFRDAPSNLYSILMVHSPDYIDAAVKNNVDLVLSGHTHGGQVRLPLFGPVYSNIELPRKYMQGLHEFGKTQLYVSRGLGTVLFPVRFFCPPEITVIELLPE